jgi:Zn-dependent M28 family amino/carboxypeptidase
MKKLALVSLFVIIIFIVFIYLFRYNNLNGKSERSMSLIEIGDTADRLKKHLRELTVVIGERSVVFPDKLKKSQEYIRNFYESEGLKVRLQPYRYHNLPVANVIADFKSGAEPSVRYIVGAHYDSVAGTVGADDNASAVAVQLEVARLLKKLSAGKELNISVRFVSFTLEEPPAYGGRYMGSRVYAGRARKENEKIDGMICLEMVGYTCSEPGCQDYPFPLNFMGYPKTGDFIGIVGDTQSRSFMKSLAKSFKKNGDLPVVKLSVPLKGYMLPNVRLSDHASFWDKGYSAVMVTDTAFYRNHNYHQKSDTMEKLNYRYMAELVESILIFFLSHR